MLVSAQVDASSQGLPLPFRVGLPLLNDSHPDNHSSTCPFVSVVILKGIKLTSRVIITEVEPQLSLGGLASYLATSFFPAVPCRVMSTVLAHRCPRHVSIMKLPCPLLPMTAAALEAAWGGSCLLLRYLLLVQCW